jgi:hypothetical protein
MSASSRVTDTFNEAGRKQFCGAWLAGEDIFHDHFAVKPKRRESINRWLICGVDRDAYWINDAPQPGKDSDRLAVNSSHQISLHGLFRVALLISANGIGEVPSCVMLAWHQVEVL